jgi:hypothetical protein
MTLAITLAILATIGWIAVIVGLWLMARLAFKLGDQPRSNRADALKFRDFHFTPLTEGAQDDHAER